MTTTSPDLGPFLTVYGLVGQDERLLIIRDPGTTTHRLPGGPVQAGEPVEYALRRILRAQVDAHVARMEFCAAVESRHDREVTESAVYELAFLFDVTFTEPDVASASQGELRWATETELVHLDLRPKAIADRLRTGGLGPVLRIFT